MEVTRCGAEQICVNLPGSYMCEPKKTEKIKTVILGESMEFLFFFFLIEIGW